MQELTYFYLKDCPYCHKADRILAQVTAASPELAAVPIRRIEELEQAALADSYDYYFVPCFFLGDKKLMEGDPDEAQVRAALTAAAGA